MLDTDSLRIATHNITEAELNLNTLSYIMKFTIRSLCASRSLCCKTFLVFTLFLTCSLILLPQVNADELISVHVKKGTNLIHLARDYCTSRTAWKEIAQANQLKEPYIIQENSTLLIPLRLLLTEGLSAQVAYVSGSVELLETSGHRRTLKSGEHIYTGQSVVTGSDGYIQLIFPDKKFTRIEPDSQLTITYLFKLLDGAVKAELYLEQGRLVHNVKKKLKKSDSFNTRTAVSITGIRGTEFRMKMEDDSTNVVETLRGLVQLKNSDSQQVLLKKGEGSRVKQGESIAPPKPLPSSPVPPQLADVYRTLPISIKLPAMQDVKYIRLRVAKDTEGNRSVIEQLAAPDEELLIMSLEDGKYSAFFTAVNHEGFESPAAQPVSLTVRTVPAAPVISSPKNAYTSWDEKLEMRWLRSDQAEKYHTELAKDEHFNDIIENLVTDNPAYLTPRLEQGTYYFRVKAIAADGFNSNYSQHVQFSKVAQPAMGKVEGSTTEGIHLQWPVIMKNCTYDMQIAKDIHFADIFTSEAALTENSFTLDSYVAHGTYYVRIRATLENGLQSQWAPAQKLYIKPEPLTWKHAVMGLSFLALIAL